jgi:hypothetical protein
MSSRLSWAKSFCLSDLYIWSKKFSHSHVVAAVVRKVVLPQWSLYISGARSSVISMSSRLSWAKSFCLSDLYIWSKKFSHFHVVAAVVSKVILPQWSLYISGARSSVISMSSQLSWAKSFCLSDLYIWSKEFSHFHVVAAVVSKVILPQWSLYISGARSSVISMSSQLSWAKSFCLSDLYIYLEQEVQSFGLWEKWSQYGGIGVQ